MGGLFLKKFREIAERRKRVLEGATLKLDLDVVFLHTFVAKVFTYVTDPHAQAELMAQTSPKSPLRIWGAKPTVSAVERFDEQPCGATAE